MKFVELFAGIGGFSLGFERVGLECVGHVEIDAYAQKVLKKHWPDVKLLSDVKEVKGDEFGKVDILCGGFPCQDLSSAGKQAGIQGDRSGLFDEIIRIARVCRPKYIVLENVSNLLSRPDWFGYVLGRIAEIGYDAEWEIIRASDFNIPTERKRVFIIAYSQRQRWSFWENDIKKRESKEIYNRASNKIDICSKVKEYSRKGDFENIRMDYGIPYTLDRLKCLGNSLVPQIAEYIGEKLAHAEH